MTTGCGPSWSNARRRERRGTPVNDQPELDRDWHALIEGGGKPQACGWLIDRYGVRWQIVPRIMDEMMNDRDPARSKRVTDAMLKMVKLDIAALDKAYGSER